MRADADAPAAERARAVLRTRHDAPAIVARAVVPDHTDRLETTVEGEHVVTRIERPDAGGLRATVDDYVVNLRVADAVHDAARGDGDTGSGTARPTDSDSRTHDTDNT